MPGTKKTEEKVTKTKVVTKEVKSKKTSAGSAALDVALKTKTEVKSDKIVKKPAGLSAEVFDLNGTVLEKISLPAEIFGVKINKVLIAQAVRVFRANQRLGTASTKTRGEVEGSTRKIYRQKGTGRARHGTIRAPIFVHGGIVGGPKPRDYSLRLPQKMKRAALFSVLTDKFNSGKIKVLGGIEKLEPKTKKFIAVIDKLGLNDKKKKILFITSSDIENLRRAAGNVEGVAIANAKRLSTYDILNNRNLVILKESIDELKKHYLEKKNSKVNTSIEVKR